MGRWTQYDEDSYRLPEGMKRVGYDSDSGRYHFRGQDGSLWEGPQGAQYGEMTRVLDASNATTSDRLQGDIDDEEAEIGGDGRPDGYRPLATDTNGSLDSVDKLRSDSAYRAILPFFLMVAVVLLLVFRMVHSTTPTKPSEAVLCPGSNEVYRITRGDTCWDLAQARGCSVEDIMKVNKDLRCEALRPGQAICLPRSA